MRSSDETPEAEEDLRGHVVERSIEEELRSAYLTYAVNVNTNRAIPDVRDGLKPSSRRILYAMREENLTSTRAPDKCAGVVGEVMKNYHPHGDGPIYQTLVRMAQEFAMRYPLLEGQGNFGSIDNDPPGAMRYTEVRMQRIADEMLQDIDRDTVDFHPNYKESTTEPSVLPGKLPNLLVNGTTGIGVGYMTHIPPQNLTEVIDALVYYIDHPNAGLEDLMEFVKGPDFPTGGVILGTDGIRSAYETGKGSIPIRARTHIEPGEGKDRDIIVVTEIPYDVKKNRLIEQIAKVVNEKTVEGIADVRDESDREIRVVIELKRGETPQVILNKLFKHTNLQTSFSVQSLCLVNGMPRCLNLQEMLHYYIEHRREVVRRRTAFALRRAEAQLHLLEGYRIALSNIDEIIEIVQAANSPEEARAVLIERFEMTARQASAVLALTLQRLTGLERQKINDEYADLLVKAAEYRALLESDLLIRSKIKEELKKLNEDYGDERRTAIALDPGNLTIEDLVADEDMAITLTKEGYIKRLPISTYRSQRRGGVGVRGMGTKDGDFVESIFIASNHQYLLCFTDSGRCYWLRVYEIPESSRQSRGRALANLLQLSSEENIAAVVPLRGFTEDDPRTLFFATRMGTVKRCAVQDFSRPLSSGIIAVKLKDASDRLIDARLTEPDQEIVMATRAGMSIRFSQNDVRVMGRSAMGVRGINLRDGDSVVGVAVTKPLPQDGESASDGPAEDASDGPAEGADDEPTLLVVTENGYGKRTLISEFRLQSRGGIGIIAIKASERNGDVVCARLVSKDDDLIAVSSRGMVTRMSASDIRPIGRNTQGVRIMSLQEGEQVQDIAKSPREENGLEEDELEEDAVEEGELGGMGADGEAETADEADNAADA